MAEETVESLNKRLTQQQVAHGNDLKRLRRIERVIEILIAAGYLDRWRYEKADALIDDLGIDG